MLAEKYCIVIRIDQLTGTTEYFDGIDFGPRLFTPDDETGGPYVHVYEHASDADAIAETWIKESSPHALDRYRYRVQLLRFSLEDP